MIILNPTELNDRKNERTGRAVRPSRSVDAGYRNVLFDINKTLKIASENVSNAIKSGLPPRQILQIIDFEMQQSKNRTDAIAGTIAQQFVDECDITNKERFENMLKSALNVDFLRTLSGENLEIARDAAKIANVALIKSIPDQHWGKVLMAVNDNFKGTEPNLLSRIKEIGKISDNRARVIARDQTSKINGQFNQSRQMDVGITKYDWQTAEDQRVVGNPSGLYPTGSKAHRNHYERNGRTYEWAKPPADGHPGEAIQCRCRAIPRINIDELRIL